MLNICCCFSNVIIAVFNVNSSYMFEEAHVLR